MFITPSLHLYTLLHMSVHIHLIPYTCTAGSNHTCVLSVTRMLHSCSYRADVNLSLHGAVTIVIVFYNDMNHIMAFSFSSFLTTRPLPPAFIALIHKAHDFTVSSQHLLERPQTCILDIVHYSRVNRFLCPFPLILCVSHVS